MRFFFSLKDNVQIVLLKAKMKRMAEHVETVMLFLDGTWSTAADKYIHPFNLTLVLNLEVTTSLF